MNKTTPLILSFHNNAKDMVEQEALSRFSDNNVNLDMIAVYPNRDKASAETLSTFLPHSSNLIIKATRRANTKLSQESVTRLHLLPPQSPAIRIQHRHTAHLRKRHGRRRRCRQLMSLFQNTRQHLRSLRSSLRCVLQRSKRDQLLPLSQPSPSTRNRWFCRWSDDVRWWQGERWAAAGCSMLALSMGGARWMSRIQRAR